MMQSSEYMDKAFGFTSSSEVDAPHISSSYLGDMFATIYGMAEELDVVKKALAYGLTRVEAKDFLQHRVLTEADPKGLVNEFGQDEQGVFFADPYWHLVHGIIGCITESGELAIVAHKIIDGEEVDKVNVLEEVGDQLWYLNLILRAIGKTFDDAMAANIAKLTARNNGTKFNRETTINRDLEKEREVLEATSE